MICFDSSTGYLPPGIHPMTWDAFSAQFCTGPWRIRLGRALYRAVNNLRHAGCRRAIVDGSFVSAKLDPSDYDLAFDPADVNAALLDPVLRRHDDGRRAMKAKYLGDIVPWGWVAHSATGSLYLEYFQSDRSGVAKGVVLLALDQLP
jgi:hypothetical protein